MARLENVDQLNDQLYKDGVAVLAAVADNYEKSMIRIEALVSAFVLSLEALNYGAEYIILVNKITEELQQLAIAQQKVIGSALAQTYSNSYKISGAFDLALPKESINAALSKDWAGRTFSKSVWSDMDSLQSSIVKHIDDIINTGMSKDKAVAAIQKQFGVAFNRADTLVRTETMYFINQAQVDKYKASGFDEYVFTANIDSRVSDECRALNGKRFNLRDAVVGINLPVIHPNCRCSIKPVIK